MVSVEGVAETRFDLQIVAAEIVAELGAHFVQDNSENVPESSQPLEAHSVGSAELGLQ